MPGAPGKLDPKVLLSPGLVASFIGLALFLAGYMLPAPVNTGLELIGSATTPLAMLVVGALLATLPAARLAGDWRVYLVTAFRLVIIPVIAFLVLSPFITDRLVLGVAVLLIAMPVAETRSCSPRSIRWTRHLPLRASSSPRSSALRRSRSSNTSSFKVLLLIRIPGTNGTSQP